MNFVDGCVKLFLDFKKKKEVFSMFCSQCGAALPHIAMYCLVCRHPAGQQVRLCDIVQFCGVNPDDGITDTDILNCF